MLLLLVLLVAGGVWGGQVLLGANEVAVPRLTGGSLDDARKEAETRGLEVSVVDRAFDISSKRGEVIGQDPEAGLIEEGKSIRLVLSLGPPQVRVPNTTKQPIGNARDILRSNNFEIGRTIYRYSSNQEKGSVIKQLADEGKLAWGSKVHLVISKGPPPVDVPDVSGTATVLALKQLRKKGLEPRQIDQYSESVSPGVVIRTSPAGGKTVREGDVIKVYSSLGPELRKFTLPDLRGMKTDDAVAELANMGLYSNVVEACKKGKRVIDTDPIAGSTVREEDTITLQVC
jgi:beta-lactam-binding protein with PASTA domain